LVTFNHLDLRDNEWKEQERRRTFLLFTFQLPRTFLHLSWDNRLKRFEIYVWDVQTTFILAKILLFQNVNKKQTSDCYPCEFIFCFFGTKWEKLGYRGLWWFNYFNCSCMSSLSWCQKILMCNPFHFESIG